MQRALTVRSACRVLAILAGVCLFVLPLVAQQAPPAKSPFGVGPPAGERTFAPPQASQPVQTSNIIQRAGAWLMEKQALMHRELAGAVRRFKTADPFSATLLLAAISFAYGVLHAAGPGHGKAVISSYVLADGQTVRRGILLSFMAALIQALSALVLVAILILLLRSTGMQVKAAEAWLETLSWGFVMLVGGWLLYYQLRTAFAPAHAHAHQNGNGHALDGHGHGHGHSHEQHHTHPHAAHNAHDHHRHH